MPRLSLALVVHREQGYLEPLVASILDQGAADVEIVAIDDASPDHVPAILDSLAERDARVRVRHLPSRVGLGAGRNLALEMAEGEYVWFVQTTGLLAPGALATVLDRLDATRPDVLLVQHERAGTTGGRRPGPHLDLLRRVAQTGSVTLDRCPELAGLAPGGQNKLFRREFLKDIGARFGDRGHSELSVTWPALLAAGRIAAEPAAVYIGRTPPNAVRDTYVEGSPFDALDRYEEVFAFAEAHADRLGDRRALVAPAMLRHELSLVKRVPAPEREAFLEQVAERHRRHGTAVRLPGRRTFRLRDRARAARRVLRPRAVAGRLRRRVRRRRETELERHYRARLREPVDPQLAVFAAYWYRGYSCNPRAIYERARELLPDLRAVWVVSADAADTMPAGVEYVVAGTREYYDLIARAGYFVNNVNFPNHLVKRDGTTHVMTHHGTPVKRMGFDLVDTPGADSRVGFAGLLRRCARWDFSVTQNAFTTVAWDRAFPTRHETLEVG
jgi:CDP-glycerol glycerophosphotransferase